MGLWRPVSVTTSGAVVLRHPHVVTRLEPDRARANLTVTVEARNLTGSAVRAYVDRANRPGDVPRGRRPRPGRDEDRHVLAGQVSPAPASPSRGCGGRPRWARRTSTASTSASRSDGSRVGPAGRLVRHPRDCLDHHREGRAAVHRQRPADPHPRRRLGARHAAARPPRSARTPSCATSATCASTPFAWKGSSKTTGSSTRPIGWASSSWPAGAAATSGSSGRSGSPATRRSRPRRSAIRSAGSARTRACSPG